MYHQTHSKKNKSRIVILSSFSLSNSACMSHSIVARIQFDLKKTGRYDQLNQMIKC